MTSSAKALVYAAAAGFALLMLGFLVFAASVTRPPVKSTGAADGIVVLTGGSDRRIEVGLDLLQHGSASRLLISGMNARTSPEDLFRHVRPDLRSAPCCIEFGYAAQDTIGNAAETREWVERHGLRRLIVVTSSYHMPRSLTELSLALPGAELVAHPVLPRIFGQGAWWVRPAAARTLIAEYIKLLPSYLRYAAHRTIAFSSDHPTPPRQDTTPSRPWALAQ